MPKAILQTDFSKTSVDRDARVIRGVKLMQVGKVANFRDKDGNARSFDITAELIKGLLNHAGNRSIPAHFTHDWVKSDKDALHARLGAHKNIRIDEAGDLASDLHTWDNEYGRLAMDIAESEPENAMFSAIFDYNPIKNGSKTFAVPLSFDAADLVAKGAATSAMLSAINKETDTDMTKEEIEQLFDSRLKAALAEHKPELPKNLATTESVAEAVKAALADHKPAKQGLTDDDKKEIAVLAAAEATKSIGSTAILQDFSRAANTGNEYESAIQAQLSAGAPNRGAAILRVAKDKPEIYNAALVAGKA